MLVLRATRRVAPSEQVTIDYGEDCFRDGQCLCGPAKCKYSDIVNDLVSDSDGKVDIVV